MAEPESTPSLKICTVCKKAFPATAEFFYYASKKRLRFEARCKVCINAYQKQYRTRNSTIISDERHTYYLSHYEHKKSYNRTYYAKHRKRLQLRQRVYAKEHAEQVQLTGQRYRKEHPEVHRLARQRRRARKLAYQVAYTDAQWQEAKAYWHYSCAVCRAEEGFYWTLAMDHWIPLLDKGCPGTVPWNMVPLCDGLTGCNNQKGAIHPQTWLVKKLGKWKGQRKLKEIQAFLDLMYKKYNTA